MESFENGNERRGEEKHFWVENGAEKFLELGEAGEDDDILAI